jgi:hypothetical protein
VERQTTKDRLFRLTLARVESTSAEHNGAHATGKTFINAVCTFPSTRSKPVGAKNFNVAIPETFREFAAVGARKLLKLRGVIGNDGRHCERSILFAVSIDVEEALDH